MIQIGQHILSGIPDPPAGRTWTPFEQSLILELMQGRGLYMYDSIEQLAFELTLRERIVQAALDLSKSGVQYAVFENSFCNPLFWTRTPQGGFLQRSDVPSSKAIHDIYTNGPQYGFECATAMVIVLYKAVLDTLGPNVFDRLFRDLYLFAWEFDQDLGLSTLRRADYFPGDIQYFRNPAVNPYTPEWQGENVVRLGNDLFYGHGMGVLPSAQIIANLNANRRPGAWRSAYMLNQGTQPDFRYLSQFYQKEVRQVAIATVGSSRFRWSYV